MLDKVLELARTLRSLRLTMARCSLNVVVVTKNVLLSLKMQLVDDLTIRVQSGAGGDGVVSFKRMRNNMRGIADGGNGGCGGNVYLVGDRRLDDLRCLVGKGVCASPGKDGRRTNKTGENGTSLTIPVPFGTRVLDCGNLLFEIVDGRRRHLVARGGRGGLGNAGSQRQHAGRGQPGVQLNLQLDFRLTVDIALVGFANAGKSSLLAQLTTARPAIASYPFTTITPQIGVCRIDDGQPLTIVEIPALSHNRSRTRYLKHLSNCQLIVYVIADSKDLENQLSDLREQLVAFDEGLGAKRELIVVTMDNKTSRSLIVAGKVIEVISPPPNRETLEKIFSKVLVDYSSVSV